MGNSNICFPEQTSCKNCSNVCECDRQFQDPSFITSSSPSPSNVSSSSSSRYFPMDCIGEIILYFSTVKQFMNCLILSKNIYFYICNENPFCCKNILFHYIRKQKHKHIKTYVINLRIKLMKGLNLKQFYSGYKVIKGVKGKGKGKGKGGCFLSFFPNLKKIYLKKVHDISYDIFPQKNKNNSCQVEELIIKSCSKMELKEGCLNNMKKLKILKIENVKLLSDELFKGLISLEKLSIVSCSTKIKGIYFNELKNLKELVVQNQGITDQVIEDCRKIEKLEIQYCMKFEGKSLKNMKNLIELKIYENRLIEDKVINCLTSLKEILLWRCSNITDEAVKSLINLENLQIHGCKEFKGYSLIFLKKLTKLLIYDIDIEDKVFEKLSQIVSLRLKGCPNITNKIFPYLPNLKKFKLIACPKISDQGFKDLNLLEELSLTGIGVTDEIFKGMRNLEKLFLWSCSKITGENFSYLGRLKLLEINANYNITDENLESLTNLERLYFFKCHQFKEKFSHNLDSLKTFWITENKNVTGKFLQYLPNLTKLVIINCKNLDGKEFGSLLNLEYLKIYFNSKITVEDLKVFSGKNLKKLSLSNCPSVKEDELKTLDIKEIYLRKECKKIVENVRLIK